ncbi:hypothetical protein SAMN06296273_0701 [Nitrosomonas ureae]|uniref:Uncharacterized protein n=2 Tax=Nitrosomonas ureae TaxID=44577 RepID=A0A285BVL3_9PROT|nr:hypothetical protein SAMN06296273_0701 [Nitrosomonas ureae]
MRICDLSQGLGISRQMVVKLKKRGMPTDSLQAAIAWRESNIDPFRSKSGRIGGNTGVKYQYAEVNKSSFTGKKICNEAELKVFEETVTETIPNLYFERVDWLAMALKDAGVRVTGAQVIEIQDNLFVSYLEELIYGRFQINRYFELPPLSLMKLDSPERKAVIASLDKILSEELTL